MLTPNEDDVTHFAAGGLTAWLLASNSLLAATFSTVSIWRSFDPLPVLLTTDDRDDDEDELEMH